MSWARYRRWPVRPLPPQENRTQISCGEPTIPLSMHEQYLQLKLYKKGNLNVHIDSLLLEENKIVNFKRRKFMFIIRNMFFGLTLLVVASFGYTEDVHQLLTKTTLYQALNKNNGKKIFS